MSVYKRPDSKFWWLLLEGHGVREATQILVGETTTQRHDNKALATAVYQQRMRELGAGVHRLPTDRVAIRFAKYAAPYLTDVIALRRGSQREGEILKVLGRYFDALLLTSIDADQVRRYMATRTTAGVQPRTVNREVDLLKGMLRDAVPKYLEASPLVGLKRLKPAPLKRRLLSVAEEGKLLAVCEDAQDRAILILGIDTLTRLGDLLDLERTDRDGPWLYVKDPKSGAAYETALSKRCQAALDAIDRGPAAGTAGGKCDVGFVAPRYYFAKFRRAENPRDWPGSVRKRLRYLCREAKLPYGKTKGGITFHWATRRTGATRYLIDRKAPISIVQRQGNWKHPELLLQVYAEARQNDQLKMVGAITSGSRRRRNAR